MLEHYLESLVFPPQNYRNNMAVPQVRLHPDGPTVSQMVFGTWRLANSNGWEADPSLATPESVLERIEACK